MCLVVGWPIVETFADCQLDPIHELHVRAFIDFVGVAGSVIGNEEAKRAPRGIGQWSVTVSENHDGRLLDRSQWNTRVEVVSRRMQPDMGDLARRTGRPQNRSESNGSCNGLATSPPTLRWLGVVRFSSVGGMEFTTVPRRVVLLLERA